MGGSDLCLVAATERPVLMCPHYRCGLLLLRALNLRSHFVSVRTCDRTVLLPPDSPRTHCKTFVAPAFGKNALA
jgi:hypothetical protein